MNTRETPALTRRNPTFLAVSLLGLLTAACASEEPVSGTWAQSDAQTPLPWEELGVPEGTMLNIAATWEFDDTENFTVDMDFEALGLTDVATLEGTYIADGAELELTFNGFVVDPASENTTRTAEDGAQCIVLSGFLGTEVCFQTPQARAYTVGADALSMSVEHTIVGVPGQTDFDLARTP